MKFIIMLCISLILATMLLSQNQIEIDSVKGSLRDAIRITYAGENGIRVTSAAIDGFHVNRADKNGITLEDVGDTGFFVNDAGRNGLFVGRAVEHGVFIQSADDYGVRAYGKKGNYFRGDKGLGKADITLGGLSNVTSEDNGTISSDPQYPSSDIFLASNDAVVLRLDQNGGEEGNFEVWDSEGDQLLVMLEGGQFEVWDGDGKRKLLLETNGDLTIDGMLTELSDQNRKENIQLVDNNQVLKRLHDIPVSTWNYINDKTPHLGPMAQDFYRAFQLGTDKGISGLDLQGVLLASIQAQQVIIEQQQQEIDQLTAEQAKQIETNQSLQAQIDALKRVVTTAIREVK